MTQAQLSKVSGLSSSYLTQLESSADKHIKAPGAAKLAALARALGVSMEWLSTGDGDGPKQSRPKAKPRVRRAS